MGFRASVSLRPAIQATERLALAPVGLRPTEHVCLPGHALLGGRMIGRWSIASETGLWLFERSARSAPSSIWACGSITRSLSRRPRARPAEHHEVVGKDAEAHPSLHPGEAAISAA